MDRSPRRWHLLAATPGRRFIDHFRRKREASGNGIGRKLVFGGGGTLLALVGIVLLFAPGPGVLLLFAGGALIAQQSERAARLLDWLEIRLRRIGLRALAWWSRTSTALRGAIVVLALVIAGTIIWTGYYLFFT